MSKSDRGRKPPGSHEDVWRRYDEVESRLAAGLSERMLDLAGIGKEMRVLDLASGRGEPSIRAARRVGPSGLVVAVEIADGLLEMARKKAHAEGLSNIDFRAANAEEFAEFLPGSFDAATSRWGLMYMSSPVAALNHCRRALSPSGNLVVALWAEPDRVPYFSLPREILGRHRALPQIDREAPGTFHYADLDRIERDFAQAGFAIDDVEEIEVMVFESEAVEEVISWSKAMGMAKYVEELSASAQKVWELEMSEALERHRLGKNVRLGGMTRIVRAIPNGS